jgi:hypothetical protein
MYLKFSLKEFEQLADDLGVAQDQVAFASMRTLNDAMFAYKDELSTVIWPRHESVRNPHYPSAVLHVDKATKLNLTATLRETKGVILAEHDVGSTRHATDQFAVPMPQYRAGKETQHGLRADARLRAILAKPNARRVVRIHDNRVYIGVKGPKLRLAFVLKPSINVPADVPITQSFIDFVKKYVNDELPDALQAAMRTRFSK